MARPINPSRMPPVNKKVTEEVVSYAGFALARRFTKGQVKTLLMEKFSLAPRTCENAITLARAQLATLTGKTANELREEAYRFYDSILRDSDATPRDKVLAQERIDKLFGLEGPIVVDLRGMSAASELVKKAAGSPEGAALLEQLDDLLNSQREPS